VQVDPAATEAPALLRRSLLTTVRRIVRQLALPATRLDGAGVRRAIADLAPHDGSPARESWS
jgi:hypothetical protein